ncbi:MAG: transglutaminase family protein [Saprospiraceae bacterium]|nr:transglutaminase family protein [Saprospiraceae bacterium]
MPAFDVDLINSSFTVEVPQALGLRYKANFKDSLPHISEIEDAMRYSWRFNDLIPVKQEVFSPDQDQILPVIFLAANEFEYDGHPGSMQSWSTFGHWLYSLLETRSSLGEREIAQIKSIAGNQQNIEDKIKVLYEYMQSKTRYVSIQLGIGGYQPMPAQSVADLGYGDCKALSNYMRVILQAAGIPAHYTVIGAGRNEGSFTFTDFPNSFQANHVILTVPTGEDTIFLECTSQKNPYGYLGSFTGNRNALLVNENGGYLIKTTNYQMDDYLQKTLGSYKLNHEGSLDGNFEKTYTSVASEEVVENQLLNKDDQRTAFLRKINIPSINLIEIGYEYRKDQHPVISEKVNFNVPRYGQTSGTRIFFNPNLFTKWNIQLPEDQDRQQPLVIDEPTYEIDSIVIKLSVHYKIEAMPPTINLQNQFGQYSMEIKLENNQIVYYRKLQIFKDKHPKEMYNDLRLFLRTIQKTDQAQIVLVENKT